MEAEGPSPESILEPATATTRMLQGVARALAVAHVALYRLDGTGDAVCVAVGGRARPEAWIGQRVPAGTGLLDRAIADGGPASPSEGLADPPLTLPEWARVAWQAEGLGGMLAVPVVADGTVLGALVIGDRPDRVLEPARVELLSLFADQAALGLEYARLHEQTRLRETRLVQSEKLEALGRLAGGIAHEFNNMLTVIVGRTEELLGRPALDPSVRHQVTRIQDSAARLTTLTQQLMTFAGRQVVQPKVVDVNVLVRGMEDMLRRVIGEDIELVLAVEAGVSRVYLDPGQLEHVMLTLALHGRDAMPQGGRLTLGTATVTLSEHDAAREGVAPGPYVRLTVADSGAGLDPDTRIHLFDPFAARRFEPGIGLGLASVYGAVRQNRGAIAVDSRAGAGTEFRIYLPPAADTPVASADPGPAEARSLGTVLVVEDDAGVLDLVREVLVQHGYTVLAAGSAADAIRLTDEHEGPIEILLTDVVMPRISGRDLAERLLRARPGIRVLYMSGHVEQTLDHHGATAAGFIALQKPFTASELLRVVRGVLQASSQPAADDTSAGLGLPKVVVRYANGTLLKGYTRDFHPNKPRFQVLRSGEPQDQGISVTVKDLKAVFFVRDFVGNSRYDEQKTFPDHARPSGRKVEVKFVDGEALVGYTLGYDPQRPGFFLFPADPQSNNLRVFIVSVAVGTIRTL